MNVSLQPRKLFVACVLALSPWIAAAPAEAVHWLNSTSLRLAAMGGIDLAAADEVAELTLFNFENPAGLALLPRESRLDLCLSASLPDDADGTTEVNLQGLWGPEGLQSLQGEYRGLIYWPADRLALQMIAGADYWSHSYYPYYSENEDQVLYTGARCGLGRAGRAHVELVADLGS